MPRHPLLPAAVRTVAACCTVARQVQHGGAGLDRLRQLTKDDRSPVTVADFAVQAVAAMLLSADHGRPHIVGEERADLLRDGGAEGDGVRDAVLEAVRAIRPRATVEQVLAAIDGCDHDASADAYWALDPIDGTKGFLRGQQYAIALGRIENGAVTLGVMGCPNLPVVQRRPLDRADARGAMYVAARGQGTWELPGCAPESLLGPAGDDAARQVRAARYDEGPVRVCESVEAEHSRQSDTARIVEAIGGAGAPVRLDSQCKYAVVARGQAHAYLRMPTRRSYVEKIWDHAAGSLIASEAGAIVSDIGGRPLDFSRGRRLEANRGIVCAAPGLHERIVELIEALGLGIGAE